MLFLNPNAVRTSYPADLAGLLNMERARESQRWLATWPRIAADVTPLRDLPDLARQLGVARFAVKDEAQRSSLASFKALGAPVALVRQILRLHPQLVPDDILMGRHADALQDYCVISATDGNHGRALAAAARDSGCRCVIVLHAQVSAEREAAIADHGAQIVRIAGNYDDSVAEAARLAAANGWQVISDTSYDGYEDVPRDVMQGYAIIAREVVAQTAAQPGQPGAFSHVFLQGGVGGMAAGVLSCFWEFHAAERPFFIVVEPDQADCLLQSAIAGRATSATGSVDSVMAGLACGDASPLAWRFLHAGVDAFMTITDDEAVDAMRQLARGSARDIPVLAGESGVAGLAALRRLRADPALSGQVGLDETSHVLIINTEGATAPSVYADLVGEPAEAVLERQRSWRAAC